MVKLERLRVERKANIDNDERKPIAANTITTILSLSPLASFPFRRIVCDAPSIDSEMVLSVIDSSIKFREFRQITFS